MQTVIGIEDRAWLEVTYFSVENITKGEVFMKACAVAQPAAMAATERRILVADRCWSLRGR